MLSYSSVVRANSILYLMRLTRTQTDLHETASLSIQEVAYTRKTKQNSLLFERKIIDKDPQ